MPNRYSLTNANTAKRRAGGRAGSRSPHSPSKRRRMTYSRISGVTDNSGHPDESEQHNDPDPNSENEDPTYQPPNESSQVEDADPHERLWDSFTGYLSDSAKKHDPQAREEQYSEFRYAPCTKCLMRMVNERRRGPLEPCSSSEAKKNCDFCRKYSAGCFEIKTFHTLEYATSRAIQKAARELKQHQTPLPPDWPMWVKFIRNSPILQKKDTPGKKLSETDKSIKELQKSVEDIEQRFDTEVKPKLDKMNGRINTTNQYITENLNPREFLRLNNPFLRDMMAATQVIKDIYPSEFTQAKQRKEGEEAETRENGEEAETRENGEEDSTVEEEEVDMENRSEIVVDGNNFEQEEEEEDQEEEEEEQDEFLD